MKFVRLISFASVLLSVLLAVLILVGCAGIGAQAPDSVDFLARQAMMDRAIADASVLTSENFAAEASAVADLIRSRGEFKDVYVDREGQQVIWAEFADERLFAISRTRRQSVTTSALYRSRERETPGFNLPPNGKAAAFYNLNAELLYTNVASQIAPISLLWAIKSLGEPPELLRLSSR